MPTVSILENVHWFSIPVHISDPTGVAYGGATWRVMFEKIIGLLNAASRQDRIRRRIYGTKIFTYLIKRAVI